MIGLGKRRLGRGTAALLLSIAVGASVLGAAPQLAAATSVHVASMVGQTSLTAGVCGNIPGRNLWHFGTAVQCHRMFSGRVVELRVGPTLNLKKYTGTPAGKQMAYAREYWATQGRPRSSTCPA